MKNKMLLLLALIAASSGVVSASATKWTAGADVPKGYFADVDGDNDQYGYYEQDDSGKRTSNWVDVAPGELITDENKKSFVDSEYAQKNKGAFAEGSDLFKTNAKLGEKYAKMGKGSIANISRSYMDNAKSRYNTKDRAAARNIASDLVTAGAYGSGVAELVRGKNTLLNLLLNNTGLGQKSFAHKLRGRGVNAAATIMQTALALGLADLIAQDGSLTGNGIRAGINRFRKPVADYANEADVEYTDSAFKTALTAENMKDWKDSTKAKVEAAAATPNA